jgi:hypothetical protein
MGNKIKSNFILTLVLCNLSIWEREKRKKNNLNNKSINQARGINKDAVWSLNFAPSASLLNLKHHTDYSRTLDNFYILLAWLQFI